LSLFLFSTTDASTPYPLLVVYMMLLGAGLGFFASPNISSIMGSVPPVRRGIASGFRATFFNVGYTISLNLAILITTFTVPYALVTRIISSGGTGISEADRILFAQGLKTTYLWLAGLNTLAILPSMLRGRRTNAQKPAPSLIVDPRPTVWLRGKSCCASAEDALHRHRGGPQRLSTPHAFSSCLRSQVKGSPLDVPPRQRGRSSRRCLAFPAIRRCGRRPVGSRLPHPGGRASGMEAQRRGASDLPHRRVRPPARVALPARRRPVSAPGADMPARPARDARPCDSRGRGGPRQDDRGGASPEGVCDPGPRPPGPDPHARLVDGAMAGGDGIEVRVAVRGPPIRWRLGTPAVPDRDDRHREARPPPCVGPTDAVGPRNRGRGPSPQESAQRELAVRRRPLEEVHVAPDRHPGPE